MKVFLILFQMLDKAPFKALLIGSKIYEKMSTTTLKASLKLSVINFPTFPISSIKALNMPLTFSKNERLLSVKILKTFIK